nr:MAG: major capsid protein [Microvirus sp.]
MAKVFNRTASVRPGRSVFNLSYTKLFTCDMGQLIPVLHDEVVPGDHWNIGNEVVVRMQPMVAPVLHEINCYVHYFFVPYRLLWDEWEDFITGGVDGESTAEIPTWSPTLSPVPRNGIGSLWDFLGYPVGVVPSGALPIDFGRRAYNLIYNEYYRNQNLQDEIPETEEKVKFRNWEKDYFTSSLPWQQRGPAPALPISGSTAAVWDDSAFQPSAGNLNVQVGSAAGNPNLYAQTEIGAYNLKRILNGNEVDLSSATTFNVADLRLAFQLQKWAERNARAGVRYVEFLGAHFGVNPRDDRLQRPEYIGGTKCPVVISEVLQTSSTDTESPQGNLAGHGIAADRRFAASYRATEFGLVMGIMSIMPRSMYQQGVDRQWLRRTRYDFYFPEFANLSEQGITHAEIFAKNADATKNQELFGFIGRYDEMRIKRSLVCGLMRDTLDYWHLGRQFSNPDTIALNSEFVSCNPDKRIFAAPTEPGFIVSFGNLIRAVRPLPVMSNPGLIDH